LSGSGAVVAPPSPVPSGRLCVGWRPEALRLGAPEDAAALGTGTVRVVESLGPERLIHVGSDLSPWDAAVPSDRASVIVRTGGDEPPPRVDDRVGLLGRAEDAHLFDADGRSLAPPIRPGG